MYKSKYLEKIKAKPPVKDRGKHKETPDYSEKVIEYANDGISRMQRLADVHEKIQIDQIEAAQRQGGLMLQQQAQRPLGALAGILGSGAAIFGR